MVLYGSEIFNGCDDENIMDGTENELECVAHRSVMAARFMGRNFVPVFAVCRRKYTRLYRSARETLQFTIM